MVKSEQKIRMFYLYQQTFCSNKYVVNGGIPLKKFLPVVMLWVVLKIICICLVHKYFINIFLENGKTVCIPHSIPALCLLVNIFET